MKFPDGVKLFFGVKVTNRKMVLEVSDEGVILFNKFGPVLEISCPKSNSKGFACVGWANTAFCCSNHAGFILAFSFVFVHSISQDLYLRNDMSSGGDLKSTFIVDAIFIKLLEFFKHTWHIYDDSVAKNI
jgi:hypothetical protein